MCSFLHEAQHGDPRIIDTHEWVLLCAGIGGGWLAGLVEEISSHQ